MMGLRQAVATSALWLLAHPRATNAACDGATDYSYVSVRVEGVDGSGPTPAATRCALPAAFPGLPPAEQDDAWQMARGVFVESGSRMCSAADVDTARKAVQAALTAAGCAAGGPCEPVLLVGRGDCTFVEKLNHSSYALQGLGDVAPGRAPTVLVIDNVCGPYISMGLEGLDAHVRPAFCPTETRAALGGFLGQPASLQLAIEHDSDAATWARAAECPEAAAAAAAPERTCTFQWDGSLAVLLILATSTVVIGSRASGNIMLEKLRARNTPLPSGTRAPPPPQEDESVVITAKMAAFYGVFASCGLLLMYLFLESIVMFMVCYVIFVSSCVAAMLTTGWLTPHLSAKRVTFPPPVRKILCGAGQDVLLSELLICIACATIGITFFVNRHEPWSWILQDTLCLHLCVYVIRTFELPNAKVAAILLCGLFLYDIFWVYVSPFLVALWQSWQECSTAADLSTDPNNSVMVHVARGVPADPANNKPAESIPIVIRMPRWGDDGSGGVRSESMLGLGDIIIPALSTALLWRFDLAAGRSWSGPAWLDKAWAPHPGHFLSGYFVPSVVGYLLALCCAYFVVANWCLAQPALLYIVPLSLWTVLALAHKRGDLAQLWSVGPDPRWIPALGVTTRGPVAEAAASAASATSSGGTGEGLLASVESDSSDLASAV